MALHLINEIETQVSEKEENMQDILDSLKLGDTCRAVLCNSADDGKATAIKRFPFTIFLKSREPGEVAPTRSKSEPDLKATAIGIVDDVAKQLDYAHVLCHGKRH
jgi:hypothetical protein